LDAYIYGSTLHLLVASEAVDGFSQYVPTVIMPTLEDVFIYFVKSKRGEMSA
jgi:ABC-2 type transport system ATP-binding protein